MVANIGLAQGRFDGRDGAPDRGQQRGVKDVVRGPSRTETNDNTRRQILEGREMDAAKLDQIAAAIALARSRKTADDGRDGIKDALTFAGGPSRPDQLLGAGNTNYHLGRWDARNREVGGSGGRGVASHHEVKRRITLHGLAAGSVALAAVVFQLVRRMI